MFTKNIKSKCYLFVLAIYLGGIIFIGSIVLTPATFIQSLAFGLNVSVSYIIIIYLLSKYLQIFWVDKNSLNLSIFATFLLTTSMIVLHSLVFKSILESIYYFYVLMFVFVTFFVSFLYCYSYYGLILKNCNSLKMEFGIFIEILKAMFLATIVVILGTAYSQLLGTNPIESKEMILIIWTYIGIFFFIIIPLIKILFNIIYSIEKNNSNVMRSDER